MTALSVLADWEVDSRPASRSTIPMYAPVLNPAQYVPAEVHQTPPEVMKLDLPQRIHRLVELHGSPLLVLDRAKLIQEFEHFRRLLPRVKLYYAVKANPHPDVIRTFAELGACYDVASEAEMRNVLSCGVEPDRIIFANTVKRPEALQFASKAGVDFVTFDSEPELYKIARHSPGCRVLCRLKVDNIGSQVALSLKFGADFEQVVPMLLKARSLGLRAEGISFHVGSQCQNYENYQRAFEMTAALVKDAAARGLELKTIDIGGGFPIRCVNGDRVSMTTFGARMRQDLDRLLPAPIELIAEPGRALVGPAGTLITRVVGRSIRNNLNYHYLDDGIYGDFSGILFDHSRYDFKALKRTPKFLSVLAGPTCDSIDVVAHGVELPELDAGDMVYVPNIGAYSCASAMAFNGIPPAKVMVIG